MRRTLAQSAAVIAALALAPLVGGAPVQAASTAAEQTYALLFKEGTLDGLGPAEALRYTRDVQNSANPEAATRDSGEIALSIEAGEEGAPLASLRFEQGGQHRGLGSFPASVGNPMIMYFYETVIRDMAETAGGSPFYIRNRVKEALVAPAQIDTGEAEFGGETVATQTVTLRPFSGDPNGGRMQGFGDLELRVTMSEAVPGWYLSFTAEAPAADGGAGGYRSALRLAEGALE